MEKAGLNIKNNKGVSIITLAITMGVLIILTAVTISSLEGNDGLISSAENVRNTVVDAEKVESETIKGFEDVIPNSVDFGKLLGPGEGEDTGEDEHLHSWVMVNKKNATCEEEGIQYFECACGEKNEKKIVPLGHLWGERQVVQISTCTVKGTAKYICTRCSKEKTEEIATTSHVFSKQEPTATYLKSEATCEKQAEYYYRCQTCTESSKSTTGAFYKYGSIGGHNYDGGKITTEPTCDAEGVKTFTCSNCGNTYTEAIAAKGHNYDGGKTTTEPTCDAEGVKTYTCSNCGNSYTEAIAAIGHKEVNGGTEDAHTKCSVCGETLSPAHSYKEEITKEANCTETGVKTFTCDCGYVYTEDIESKGHTPGEEATCTTPQTCTVCDSTINQALDHSWNGGEITKEATCGSNGIKTYTCERCGTTHDENVDSNPNNHTGSYSTEYEQIPGDTTYGKEKKICNTCGVIVSTQSVQHTWNGGLITAIPDCTWTGTMTYTCSRCGATKTETLDRDLSNHADRQYNGIVTVDDYSHGAQYYCYYCDVTWFEYIEDHSYDSYQYCYYCNHTCTHNASGWYDEARYCKACNDVVYDSVGVHIYNSGYSLTISSAPIEYRKSSC